MNLSLTLKIEDVKIKPGQVFDFVGILDHTLFSDDKFYLIYKYRFGKNQILFTLKQAFYFTVKGEPMHLPLGQNFDSIDKINMDEPWDNTKKDGLNFADSFEVLKGNDGIIKHRPNLDINQPIFGIGTEWMLSSINRKLELEHDKLKNEEDKKKQKIKKAKEDENKLKIEMILAEEEVLASNENEYETLTRHFLNFSTEIDEFFNSHRNG